MRVCEHIYDESNSSPQEVDLQLKCLCEQFIADTTTSLTHPLKSLLSKYDVIFQLAEKDSHDPATLLHHQPFAGAGRACVCVCVSE